MSETLRELLVEVSYKDKATSSLDKVDKKVDDVKDNFGSMAKSAAGASAKVADLGTRTTKLSKDINRIDRSHKLWQQTASAMERTLGGNKKESEALRSKINVLDREIVVSNKNLEKTKKLYGENSKEALAYKDHILDLRLEHEKLNRELGGLSAARVGQSLTKAGGVMTSAGSWMTTRLTLPIVATAGASLKTFITLEDAFSGVEKTVDGTEKELKSIRKELDYMASNTIPVARKELYGIAENAGQLGVSTPNVTRFTSTIAKLGATTNLTYDDASSMLAQFASFTSMDISNIDRLGASIVELGNNTETTEKDIVEMAMRVGAAGKQVRMTHSEIMGLSAGLASLGLSGEAGGTAVSKLLFDMQEATMTGNKQLGKYAKVAKMSSREFKKAFEENAANALVLFTEGLGELQNNGENVIGILNDMGLSEVRLRDAILRAAGANGKLNTTINMGNIAWEQNIALNEEFSKKSKTSASNIQLMKSKVEEVGNAFGEHLIPHVNDGLDGVTKMVNKFGELSPSNQKKVFDGLLGVAVAGPALKTLGKFATKLGVLNTAVATAGGWGPYLAGAGASITAFATGPVGIAIAAIAVLSAGIYGVIKAMKNLDSIHENQMDNVKKMSEKSRGALGKNKNAGIAEPKSMAGGKNKASSSASKGRMGRNALGTNYWRGGHSELGERGVELVIGRQTRNLARGAKVVNNRDTEGIFSKSISRESVVYSDNYETNLYITMPGGSNEDIQKLKKEIERVIEPTIEKIFAKAKMKRLSRA